MVRLVVLTLILMLSACSSVPQQPQLAEPEIAVNTVLPIQQLDEGEHHPAVASLLQQAEQARQLQRYGAAASYVDQAREIEPRNADIYYRQAWLALSQAQAIEAESFARRGLVFAAYNSDSYYRLQWLLADSLEEQGRLMEAMVIRAKLSEHQ